MSHEYCILNLLNIKDTNVKLLDNFYKLEKIDNITFLMSHYIVLNADVFLTMKILMKKMDLKNQIY